jgi:hypothetical protein
MHTPGKLVEFKDRQDVVRALRWPWECIAPEDGLLIDALRYWQSLRAGGLLPLPRAIDPIALKPLLGWIHKVDTSDLDPLNYFFRLWGSNVPLEEFASFRGMRVSAYPSAPYRESVMQDYHDVVASGVPSYQQVLASLKYREYSYARLILPLADDGRRVTQLLVCLHSRAAETLSERVIAGTWVTSSRRLAADKTSDTASGHRAQRFSVIDGGKPH